MSTQSAPLNAEPADREGRQEAGLQPKSFADAAQQEVRASASKVSENHKQASATNDTDRAAETEENGFANGVLHTGEGGELKHSVLKIVDTGVESKEAGDDKQEFEAAVSICLLGESSLSD